MATGDHQSGAERGSANQVDSVRTGQLDFDLGDHGRVQGIGNKPLLMVFKFFALASTERAIITKAPWGGMTVELRCESNPKYGLATQFDKHFFMFVISKMAHIKRTTERTPKHVNVSISEYLRATSTTSTGYAYDQVRRSIDRLETMRIYTNIEMNGRGVDKSFTWFQGSEVHYDTRTIAGVEKRCMTAFTITPCDWIVAAIEADAEILTYAPEYFQLKSSFVQRVYEVARVESEQDIFKISLAKLMLQTGSGEDVKAFRKNFRRQVVGDAGKTTHVPEHAVYAYSSATPEQSVDWSRRVKSEDQWYVFVRDAKQDSQLNLHLDNIPEWEPLLSDFEMQTISSSAKNLTEGPMRPS